jgi:hypothetical protein
MGQDGSLATATSATRAQTGARHGVHRARLADSGWGSFGSDVEEGDRALGYEHRRPRPGRAVDARRRGRVHGRSGHQSLVAAAQPHGETVIVGVVFDVGRDAAGHRSGGRRGLVARVGGPRVHQRVVLQTTHVGDQPEVRHAGHLAEQADQRRQERRKGGSADGHGHLFLSYERLGPVSRAMRRRGWGAD